MTGVPDRIILLPGGKIGFVETKRLGEKPRPIQRKRIRDFKDLGFKVYVLDNINDIDEIIKEIGGDQLEYRPHKYQDNATEFIKGKEVSALLLDMGLGKTVISLTAIKYLLFDSFEISKVLIIAPLRVARVTWKEEIEKWSHLDILKYSVAIGSEKERLKALEKEADIYLINRENVDWLINKSGLPFNYDMIVLDELSSFKSHRSKRFRALMKERPKAKR